MPNNWRVMPPLGEMTFYGVLDRYRVGVINDLGANATRDTNRATNAAYEELCKRWAAMEADLDRLTREKQEAEREADALHAVGAQMANLCYNLAQRAAIEPRNREIMRDLARRWDDIPHRSDAAAARASSPSPESVT